MTHIFIPKPFQTALGPSVGSPPYHLGVCRRPIKNMDPPPFGGPARACALYIQHTAEKLLPIESCARTSCAVGVFRAPAHFASSRVRPARARRATFHVSPVLCQLLALESSFLASQFPCNNPRKGGLSLVAPLRTRVSVCHSCALRVTPWRSNAGSRHRARRGPCRAIAYFFAETQLHSPPTASLHLHGV